MQNKRIIYIALVTAGILLIPLIAMQFTSEVNWDETDFIVMGVLIFGAGLLLDFVMRKTGKHKLIAAAAVVLLFLYVWAELAVGIFNIPGISGS